MYEGKGAHRFLSLLRSISIVNLASGIKMKDYIQGVRQNIDPLSKLGTKLERSAIIVFSMDCQMIIDIWL